MINRRNYAESVHRRRSLTSADGSTGDRTRHSDRPGIGIPIPAPE
jgi:hypothetical protein